MTRVYTWLNPLPATLCFALLLTACSESLQVDGDSTSAPAEQATPADTTGSQQGGTGESVFEPDYIYAENLGQRFDSGAVPYIFDVRSEVSYGKSHIKTALSMPYGKIDDAALAAVEGLDSGSEIVTYCGCPHHLSSLAAKQLKGMGYGNVRVLYEGYWHWKEKHFPVVENVAAATTRLRVEGRVAALSAPVTYTDLFIRHRRSGQLEAVRTDASGQFALDFHLYDLQQDDRFEVLLADVNSAPRSELGVAELKRDFIEIDL